MNDAPPATVLKDTAPAQPYGGLLTLDAGELSVTSVLSTDRVDCDGDVLEPAGLDDSDHRRNPVVLLNHDTSAIVAKMMDPGGNYTVRVEAEMRRVVGKSYFDASVRDSAETFDLVARGLLRGCSVGFIPLEAKRRGGDEPGGEGYPLGLHVTRWLLKELTFTPVPANGDALVLYVQKHLTSERLRRLFPEPARTLWTPGRSLTMAPVSAKALAAKSDPPPADWLQAVLCPAQSLQTREQAAAWVAAHGYAADRVAEVELPGGGGPGWAFEQFDAARCKSSPGDVRPLKDGVAGLYCERTLADSYGNDLPSAETKMADDTKPEPKDDDKPGEVVEKDGLPADGDTMKALSGAHFKSMHLAHKAAEELHDSEGMATEERQKRCKAVMKCLKSAMADMRPDDDDDGEAKKAERADEDEAREVEKALAGIKARRARLAEMAAAL